MLSYSKKSQPVKRNSVMSSPSLQFMSQKDNLTESSGKAGMISSFMPVDHDAWWEIAAQDPHARFFQTPAWLEVARMQSDRYVEASIMGVLNNGTRFVLPMVSYSRLWPIIRYQSVFDRCYGGLIADGEVPAEIFLEIQKEIPMRPFSSFDLTETPHSRYTDHLPEIGSEMFTCCILNLEGRTFEEIYNGFSKTRREDYRKGVRSGLTVRQANPDQLTAEFDTFYQIYEDTRDNRWGDEMMSLPVDRDFLHQLEQLMQKMADHIKLWIVEKDGEPISAAINFHWNGHVDGWAMATKPDYFKLKPTVVLMTEMIWHAIELGERVFDFGPNMGKQSIIDFKKRFGAELVQYKAWHWQGGVVNLFDRIRG